MSIIDRFHFKTRSTIPFGWLIKLGRQILFSVFPAKSFNFNVTVPDDVFVTIKAIFLSVVDRFCSKTGSTIPLGWLIKLGRRIFSSVFPAKSFNFNKTIPNDVFVIDKVIFLSIVNRFYLKTRSSIPFGWLINLGKQVFFSISPAKSFSGTVPDDFFVDKILVDDDDVNHLKTRNTIPFG